MNKPAVMERLGFVARPVTAVIGADIEGVDLNDELSDDAIEWLGEQLVTYKVLFFHDQASLTPDRQAAFGRRFGALEVHPVDPHLPGHPDVTVFEYGEQRTLQLTGREGSWHADLTLNECPPALCLLRAITIPEFGRDTVWADMEVAYDRLSEKMKALLDGLTAVHGMPTDGLFDGKLKDGQVFRPIEHPLVRTHPVSGRKSLFVNRLYTHRIVGLNLREGQVILDFLLERVNDPEIQVRLRWKPNTVAFWDNRSTQHAIVIDEPCYRVMHRVTVAGDPPR
jgi:alpha-ketoglutarate-dependent taurine dioxygenase